MLTQKGTENIAGNFCLVWFVSLLSCSNVTKMNIKKEIIIVQKTAKNKQTLNLLRFVPETRNIAKDRRNLKLLPTFIIYAYSSDLETGLFKHLSLTNSKLSVGYKNRSVVPYSRSGAGRNVLNVAPCQVP